MQEGKQFFCRDPLNPYISRTKSCSTAVGLQGRVSSKLFKISSPAVTKSCLILEFGRETQMRRVRGKHSKCSITGPPLVRGLKSHGRAGGHGSRDAAATPHLQHTQNWHLCAWKLVWNSPGLNAPGCASCPSDVTQICFTGRFWNPSADAVCSTAVRRGANAGEGRQVKISRFRKEKGIPVCHTWRLSAFQNMWEGTTVTGKPIARLKSRKQKDSSSFPDHIQTS